MPRRQEDSAVHFVLMSLLYYIGGLNLHSWTFVAYSLSLLIFFKGKNHHMHACHCKLYNQT